MQERRKTRLAQALPAELVKIVRDVLLSTKFCCCRRRRRRSTAAACQRGVELGSVFALSALLYGNKGWSQVKKVASSGVKFPNLSGEAERSVVSFIIPVFPPRQEVTPYICRNIPISAIIISLPCQTLSSTNKKFFIAFKL